MVAVAWQLKNTTDATAATHFALVGGAVFGGFAALHYWFPKMTGRTMGETLARISFWTMLLGTLLAFFPLFLAGGAGQVVDAYKFFDGTGVSALQPDRHDRRLRPRRPGSSSPSSTRSSAAPAAPRPATTPGAATRSSGSRSRRRSRTTSTSCPTCAATGRCATSATRSPTAAAAREQPARETAAGSLTAMEADERRRRRLPIAPAPRRAALAVLRDYVTLTKPKVQSLLLLTTVDDDVRRGDPSARRCVYPHLPRRRPLGRRRRRDQPRHRPRHRPPAWPAPAPGRWPAGGSRRRTAIVFGDRCSAAPPSPCSALTVNPLAAALAIAGLLGYVFVYTLWLKRSTPQNIVIGGAAGAVPPLVAWAAATGGLSGTALPLRDRLLLDPAPLLGALAADEGRVRQGRRADAAGRPRRGRDAPPDPRSTRCCSSR